MATEEDPLGRSLRRGWALRLHAVSLVAGILAFACTIALGRVWLVSIAGMCFVLAGAGAIAGGRTFFTARGWSAGRHLLSDEGQARGERAQAAAMGVLLIGFGVFAVVFGVYAATRA